MPKTPNENVSTHYKTLLVIKEEQLKALEEDSKKMPKIYTPECAAQYKRELNVFAEYRLAGVNAPLPELHELDQCQHTVNPFKK